MRNLTIEEQRLLSQALRSSAPLVHSDNIAPVDVNILPMQIVLDPAMIDRCVEALHIHTPTFTREIVITVLRAAAIGGIGVGTAQNNGTETGGTGSPTASGTDHD